MKIQSQSFDIELADEPAEVPPFLEKVLLDFGLLKAFRSRPLSLRAGFVSLIASAQRQDLRDERIAVMLDGLADIERNLERSSEDVDSADSRSSYW